MAIAPALDDPEAFAAEPAQTANDAHSWPSGWWLFPAVILGLWFWVKIFAWLLF